MHDENCIFCKIVQGGTPAAKIYENDHVLAFLDVGPVRPGHALVIPKAHYANLLETPDEAAVPLLRALRDVGSALMKATGADGFNVMQNNFSAAGQMVFHTHWHIIPRKAGDGLCHWPQGGYENPDDMRQLAALIAAELEKN